MSASQRTAASRRVRDAAAERCNLASRDRVFGPELLRRRSFDMQRRRVAEVSPPSTAQQPYAASAARSRLHRAWSSGRNLPAAPPPDNTLIETQQIDGRFLLQPRLGLALVHACSIDAEADASFVRRLLDQNAPTDAVDAMYRTPLHLAAAGGECTLVAELLAGGASVAATDPAGDTALHEYGVAAAYLLEDERDLARAAEVVRSLLLCRAAPHAQNARGLTPLHMAARLQPEAAAGAPLVRLLLEADAADGLARRAVAADGRTAEALALALGHEEVGALLAAARGDDEPPPAAEGRAAAGRRAGGGAGARRAARRRPGAPRRRRRRVRRARRRDAAAAPPAVAPAVAPPAVGAPASAFTESAASASPLFVSAMRGLSRLPLIDAPPPPSNIDRALRSLPGAAPDPEPSPSRGDSRASARPVLSPVQESPRVRVRM